MGAGPRAGEDLGGGGYTGVALAVMRAIVRNEPGRLIVNVRNRGAIPGIAAESVVEVRASSMVGEPGRFPPDHCPNTRPA